MVSKTSCNKTVAVILGAVVIVSVLVGIALAVYFTWPKPDKVPTVILVGNFTIVNKTATNETKSEVCNYLTTTLYSEKTLVVNSYCTAFAISPNRIDIRFRLTLQKSPDDTDLSALTRASSAIARKSSDDSTFVIDQSSIRFEDETGYVQNFCIDSSTCSASFVVCVSIVGGQLCVCRAGYTWTDSTQRLCSPKCPEDGSRYCQPTDSCITKTKVCDKFQDCPNDSDEIECQCNVTYQYQCNNGRCIYKQWLCDGVKDCPQGDDENQPQCNSCSVDQLRCDKSNQCLSVSSRCDGQANCIDSSDESKCLSFQTDGGGQTPNSSFPRLVTATYQGVQNYSLCSDNWNDTWSDAVCKQMGYGKSSVTEYQTVNASFLELDSTSSSSNLMALLKISNCNSQRAVSIGCVTSECGTRLQSSDSVGPYILNGQKARRGAWPWQVVVYTVNRDSSGIHPMTICGGSLLNDRWVLTAAHCAWITTNLGLGYTGPAKPQNMWIKLGTISLLPNSDLRVSDVDKVYVHPLYNGSDARINNDVALLRLASPVAFTDTIRPICLPSSDGRDDLNRFKVCVDTGFGKTTRNEVSNDLLQARMNIVPSEECSRYNPFLQSPTQLCIGTLDPAFYDINICQGDSGGPLSCQGQDGVWVLVGVNSYVVGSATSTTAVDVCQLSVVARVTAFLDWIMTTISLYSV